MKRPRLFLLFWVLHTLALVLWLVSLWSQAGSSCIWETAPMGTPGLAGLQSTQPPAFGGHRGLPAAPAAYVLLRLSKTSGSGTGDNPGTPAASNDTEAKPGLWVVMQEQLWWIPVECGSRPGTLPPSPSTNAACPFTW